MKIFLTGGTGFIGSHFINQAHTAGHEVIALRRSTKSKPRIPLQYEPSWIDQPMSSVDARNLQGCDCLVHLAAHSANVPYDSLENCIQQNVLEPLALFRKAIESKIKRFIVAGSCFEFGASGERYELIPPHAPLEPTTSYPASKAAASVVFHSLAKEENLELLILRIFHVYGEGELTSRFWPGLRAAALQGEDFPMTDGLQIRDFIPVEQVANSFLGALERTDLQAGQPVFENLGTGNAMTLADFARLQWEEFEAAGKLLIGARPMRQGEVMRFVPKV
jgi:nucleoside-diphosphate-sugar epimerase